MDLPAHLDDGLVLRRATPADAGALVVFNGEIHRGPGEDDPDAYISDLVRSLLAGGHPAVSTGDFLVVEDRDGDIVSSLALLPEPWAYGGVAFSVGRIEFVGTRPAYRRRGLVRRQMDVAHRWCAERGFPVQAISGIPNYYRRFGYEMALEMWGGRTGFLPHVPDLSDDTPEPFRVRPAAAGDVPFLVTLDGLARERWLVTVVRDEEQWRYGLDGARSERFRHALHIIERPDGEPIGYLAHLGELAQKTLVVSSYELAPGVSWFDVTPSVLRFLRSAGESLREPDEPNSFQAISFSLGSDHPVYRTIPNRLPRVREPYAWFLRVADLPAFLHRIAPVLEERLAASVAPGYTGELLLNFYETGLRLTFAAGRLVSAAPWEPGHPEDGDALIPGLRFLQLLFGRRSLAELEHADADCLAVAEKARVLLDALLPKRPSFTWPVF